MAFDGFTGTRPARTSSRAVELESEVAEVSPERLDVGDRGGIKKHLQDHGFACVMGALSPAELEHAHDLLWAHLEGTEAATQRMTQRRPINWKREQPTSWIEGHGDALMTSTTHCESMWYVRSRPGVMGAFHAAYGTPEDPTPSLVAMYDRMSVNLPTSSGNPETLRVAAESTQHGKFGVAQQMHTHAGAREQQIGGSGGSLEPSWACYLNPLGLFVRTSIPFI
jgi:hypothetical protein